MEWNIVADSGSSDTQTTVAGTHPYIPAPAHPALTHSAVSAGHYFSGKSHITQWILPNYLPAKVHAVLCVRISVLSGSTI